MSLVERTNETGAHIALPVRRSMLPFRCCKIHWMPSLATAQLPLTAICRSCFVRIASSHMEGIRPPAEARLGRVIAQRGTASRCRGTPFHRWANSPGFIRVTLGLVHANANHIYNINK